METCTIKVCHENRLFPRVIVDGYLASESGDTLREVIIELLKTGKNEILLDFSKCSIISSPGVAAIFDSICRIQEDYKGNSVIIGLDNAKKDFLMMTGILPMIESASTIEEAIDLMKK